MERHMSGFVLIIDSDTEELRRLREILTREGYNIMTAADWETARQLSEKVEVELVLCQTSLMGSLSAGNSGNLPK